MRDDLLDAQACVDWTITNIPLFEERLQRWLKENVEVVRIDLPPESDEDMLVARGKCAVPVAFNVEAGAYINTLRSGLDILAYAIAVREKVLLTHEIYFPIATNAAEFARGNYKGSKFVKQLSRAAREAFEAARPYKGGNNAIWALHEFDILRKHKRLLTMGQAPLRMSIWGFGFGHVWRGGDLRPRGKNETILGYVRKGERQPEIHITPFVVFDEPEIFPRCSFATGLTSFASAAHDAIQRFDY
jgi:hypothetical protein